MADTLPSGFFALRTPLLPFDDFLAWSEGLTASEFVDDPDRLESALNADRARLRERLRRLLDNPAVREALYVASPDLDDSLSIWIRDPESARGARIERAIVRYFARMAGRPTPFGLFAGMSVGTIGDRTRLVMQPADRHGRRSRLDMDYLFALAEALVRDPRLRQSFTLRPNSSLHQCGRASARAVLCLAISSIAECDRVKKRGWPFTCQPAQSDLAACRATVSPEASLPHRALR